MGTRILKSGAEKAYAASESWVERALRSDGSLFTSSEAIWSSRWLGELHRRFLDHPDETGASFFEKLQGQLRGSPPEVYQLMAEVLYFHFLIVATKNSANELRVINGPLDWSATSVAIPPELVAALTPGILNPGRHFHVTCPNQLGFLIEFVEQWKEREEDEQSRLLANPWEFKEFIMGLNFRSRLLQGNPRIPREQRDAMLHLVFPNVFEAMVSGEHKDSIAKAFARLVTAPEDDVDRRLQQIRPELEAQYGSEDHLFYKPEVRSQWDDKYVPDLWSEFVRRGREYVDAGRLESEEIEYKVEIGLRLAKAREAVLAGSDDWGSQVKGGMAGNLIFRIEQSKFRHWIDEFPDDALLTLQALWTSDVLEVAERVKDFSDLLPRRVNSGPGVRLTTASVLLMGFGRRAVSAL